jgi:hypothetical protein
MVKLRLWMLGSSTAEWGRWSARDAAAEDDDDRE